MRKWLLVALFILTILLGYLLRGSIGRERFTWLIAGLLGLMLVLKLLQLGLRNHVKVREGRMSPDAHRDFGEYKSRDSGDDKTK
jgi:hypothetical protein